MQGLPVQTAGSMGDELECHDSKIVNDPLAYQPLTLPHMRNAAVGTAGRAQRSIPDATPAFVPCPASVRSAPPQKNLSQKRSGTVLTTHWKLREKAPAMTTKVMMPSSVAAIVQNAVAIFSKALRARLRSW